MSNQDQTVRAMEALEPRQLMSGAVIITDASLRTMNRSFQE